MKLKLLKHKTLSINSELVSYAVLLLAPLVFSNSQIITGIFVNTTLACNAIKRSPTKFVWMLILPSIVSLSQKLILGPLSTSLYYYILPIWISNYFYTYFINNKPKNFFLPIVSKVSVLVIYSLIIVKLNIVPLVILIPMGAIQLLTATIGLKVSQLLYKTYYGSSVKTQ